MNSKNILSMARTARQDAAGFRYSPLRLFQLVLLGYLACLCVGTVGAQVVVIDDWSTTQNVETPAEGGAVDSNAASIPSSGALGGFRNTWVEETADPNDFRLRSQVSSATRILSHSEDSGVEGFSVLIWDGSSTAPTGPTDLNPTGLYTGDPATGVDLTAGCPAGAPQAITFTVTGAQENPVDITLEIYTNGSNWSTSTKTNPATTPQSVTFDFSSDFTTGAGASGPATFTNVGAIRLALNPDGDSTQFDIITPVTSCGIDYGDAPQASFEGGIYTTTAALKPDVSGTLGIRNNTRRGPHHTIGGPWFPNIANGLGNSGTNDTDGEVDGQPSSGANGDDGDEANDDELGVSLPPMPRGNTTIDPDLGPVTCDGLDMGPTEYCAAVRVANPSGNAAQAVGWIDFDDNGVFDNNCSTSDGTVVTSTFPSGSPVSGCERSSAVARIGTTGLGNLGGTCSASSLESGDSIGGTDFSTGNVPANCEGVVVLVWDLVDSSIVTTNATFSRFRITTNTLRGFFGSSGIISGAPASPAPFGYQEDGEVEDHIIAEGTLPVSISAFESSQTRSGLTVTWNTVSETQNAGFYVWGDTGSEFRLLTPEMVASKPSDIARQQTYTIDIDARLAQGVQSLVVSAVDLRGKEEMYGLFSVDRVYGREAASSPIDWAGIDSSIANRLSSRGFSREGSTWRSPATGSVVAADFSVSSAGMQRITYQDLLDAGLDLTGVDPSQIAVTVDGRPVPRHIHRYDDGGLSPVNVRKSNISRGGSFGTNHVIDFWGEMPSLPDALYLSEYNYRVSVDPTKAQSISKFQGGRLMQEAAYHRVPVIHDDANQYSMTSVLDDPWYVKKMRANHATSSYTATIHVDSAMREDKVSHLEVVVAGDTDFPESPDHHVEVYVNGQFIDSIMFDGRVRETISAELPSGLVSKGDNTVEIRLPGGTEAAADIVYLDSIRLAYASALDAQSDRLLISDIEPDRAFTVRRISTNASVAFAWNGSRLVELPTRIAGRGMVGVTPERGDGYSFWISSPGALNRPEFAGAVGSNDLIGDSGNFLIIAHPAFIPASPWESHPLNDFINHRTADGWDVMLVDVTEIQNQYGGGMALPQAIQRFLADADQKLSYEHVLLVGGDSYDYRDNLGLGSLSFVPTLYTATTETPHTPSDALLADLDNDGLADKAIGRWPVRTLGDLQSIVSKTVDWDFGASALGNAIWVADSDVPTERSFRSQADRMISGLEDSGWAPSAIDRLYFDDVGSGIDAGDYLRDQLFSALEEGRSLTGFVGHGAPSMWTFQGLLTPNDIADLNNDGMPTLIGTMTCYTSYFVSPYSETVAHRWMNGYRVDDQGNQVAGAPNGAVAIHGAATLTNYNQNEIFAQEVQKALLAGHTLGQSVEQARELAKERGMSDLVTNWTLLGDPTVRIGTPNRSGRK